MKTLDTPYTNKTYKYCFKNIETNEWFLANKKPKGITIKTGYFGSIFATHYQYRITTFTDYHHYSKTKNGYNEHEFVCMMIKYYNNELRKSRKQHKNNPEILRYKQHLDSNRQQVNYFKRRKKQIEVSKEYLWELLKQ